MNKKYFRNLWYSLSANQRYLVRKAYYYPIDLFDKITGKTHKYVPSRGSIYTGSPSNAKEFIAQSHHQLDLLTKETNIKATSSVLDIGSGIGRTAISLSNYLNTKGSYEGFDVVKKGVDWCNSKIGNDFKNFNFTYVPLFNDLYNNETLQAEEFVFPYDNKNFDIVFSFSVFTHMQIEEIQNYLNEIYRVLSDEGEAFSTFFLYESEDEINKAALKGFNFPIEKDGYRLMNNTVKSGNIAISKQKLQEMMANTNLSIKTIIDGFWKGTKNANEYQDIVVFKKTK